MGSFGDRLRREREMRGITLDEIAESTKISRRHLEALEKEDFDSLPGGIFNRGFVRSYARYLGIDEDQAVADYSAAATEPAEAEDKFPLDVPERGPELNPRRSTLPLILALVALVAVLAIFWARMRSRGAESQESASANTPGATRSPSPVNVAPAQTPDSTPEASGENPNSSAADSLTPSGSSNSDAATIQPSASPSASQSPQRLFSLVIKAKEDSWISVTADGKAVTEGTLSAGERRAFRAGKKIVFTTGNAGGVDVTFNGKTLGTIGNESEKRVLTFTPSGLVQ